MDVWLINYATKNSGSYHVDWRCD